MTWHEYVQKTGKIPAWPYKVNYGHEKVITSDVLVIGGGVAGCRAAVAARQRGASVVVADRGDSKRSGAGGAGVDHWHGAVKNPCSKITPERYAQTSYDSTGGYANAAVRYIIGQEGWDTLLECEEFGVKIRDVDDEFKGSQYRDDETKLMFAYDNVNRHMLRIYGHNIKQCVDAAMKKLGVQVENRICVTALLTEDGKQGGRVIGAMGIHARTGEFYIFRAKAVIISTGGAGRLWSFAPEVTSISGGDLNAAGLGLTMGWRAGAEFVLMEHLSNSPMGYGYMMYSTGNNNNTYHGVPIVDAEGKRVASDTALGQRIPDEDVYKPSSPDKFVLGHGIGIDDLMDKAYAASTMETDIAERIEKGDFKLPLYADFSLMSKPDRDVVWRLMLSNEGKCREPIYNTFTRWGFDPDKDLLQMPIGEPETYRGGGGWPGRQHGPASARGLGSGGYLVDWRLQTTLPGLFVAGGGPIVTGGCHGESQTTGRYVGRQAVAFIKQHDDLPEPCRAQIDEEKERCYAPVNHPGEIGWKEYNYAIARVMADYCGRHVSEDILNLGIRRIKDLRDTEGERLYVTNPHELARAVECMGLVDLGLLVMEAVKARKCSSTYLNLKRYDYPEVDPEEWHHYIPIWQKDGEIHTDSLPLDYYLQEPYAPTLEENYQRFGELD